VLRIVKILQSDLLSCDHGVRLRGDPSPTVPSAHKQLSITSEPSDTLLLC